MSRKPGRGTRRTCGLLAALLGACGVTPLTNRIAVGEEPFVIGVGEGPDSATDLFAAPAGSGSFTRLTFNRAEERAPDFSPGGMTVAYLRRAPGSQEWSLVVLDLLNGAERSAAIPAGAGEPLALGWSTDGTRVIVRAQGYLSADAAPGPLHLVPLDDSAASAADSATRPRLGPAGEGLVEPCGATLCVRVGTALTPLGPGVSGAIRWGDDSVGYFAAGDFAVRPLGGGLTRRPLWKGPPSRLRELTYSSGVRSPP